MPQFGVFHDDGIHYVTARSLAGTGDYRIISSPEEWWQTKYSPLWPLTLSLVWRVWPAFPDNLIAAGVLVWLLLPVWVWISVNLWHEAGFRTGAVCAMGVLLALNSHAVISALALMSELQFCVLTAGTLLLAEHGLRKRYVYLALAAGVVGGLAFLTRTAGLALLISVPVCFVLRRQLRPAAYFVAAMLPFVGGWILWSRSHSVPEKDLVTAYYTGYGTFFNLSLENFELVKLAYSNLDSLAGSVASLLGFPSGGNLVALLASRAVAVALVVGAIRLWREGRMQQWTLYGLVTVLELLPFRYPPEERFVLPLLPLLLAAVVRELSHAAGLIRPTYRHRPIGDRVVAVLVAAVLGVAVGVALLQNARPAVDNQPHP